MDAIALQFDIAWEDPPANLARVRQLLDQASPRAGSLVVLPEMFTTGFTMNAAAAAEPERGPTTSFLQETARRHRIHLVAGLAQIDGGGTPRNRCLSIGPDGDIQASYTKQKPAWLGNEGGSYPAGSSPATFEAGGFTVATFICYDLRFPEVFRHVARHRQPGIFTVIASWPAARTHHWLRLLQARAIENQAYVIGVNRTGRDPDHAYDGRSVIVDFNGEILANGTDAEGPIVARLDPERLADYRRRLPFLRDLEPLDPARGW